MFFGLSKILWFVAAPGNVFFVLLLLSGFLMWTQWKRAGRRVLTILIAAGLVVAVVPVGSWIIWHLENRFPVVHTLPEQVDGIIVAGGIIDPRLSKARGQPVIGGAVERMTAASQLALFFPKARVIFSGGSGDLFNQEAKEADYVAPLFEQLGVPRRRLVFENQSRNTVENAEITLKLANPQAGENWILVTSAFHMPRAIGTFRKAGWKILAYPTDFGTYPVFKWRYGFDFVGGVSRMNHAVHEVLGLIFYRLTGKSDSFFPAPLKS